MEKFPHNNASMGEQLQDIAKKAVLAAATLVGTSESVDAQNTTPQPSSEIRTSYEDPRIQQENKKIVDNIFILESHLKELSSKTSHDKTPAYAVVGESAITGSIRYGGRDKFELVASEDLELSLVEKSGGAYRLLTRDISTINNLLSERKYIGGSYQVYTPIDKYIVVGIGEHTESSATVRVRLIDMHSRSVEYKEISVAFSSRGEIEHSQKINEAVQQYVQSQLK